MTNVTAFPVGVVIRIMLRSLLFLLVGTLELAAMARALWWIARGSSITPLPRRSEIAAASISFAMALLVTVALVFVPVYKGESRTGEISSEGTIVHESVEHNQTLLQVNGAKALRLVVIPVLIAGVPLLSRRRRWRALLEACTAVLLTGFSIIGGFSIGLFYLPSAVAMLVAALLARPARVPT